MLEHLRVFNRIDVWDARQDGAQGGIRAHEHDAISDRTRRVSDNVLRPGVGLVVEKGLGSDLGENSTGVHLTRIELQVRIEGTTLRSILGQHR